MYVRVLTRKLRPQEAVKVGLIQWVGQRVINHENERRQRGLGPKVVNWMEKWLGNKG